MASAADIVNQGSVLHDAPGLGVASAAGGESSSKEWDDLTSTKDLPSRVGQSWMRDNRSWLKELTLKQIVWPGSHDAAMSFAKNSTEFSTNGNTVTQLVPIYHQLWWGVRVFDIRPVIKLGQLVSGHFNDCKTRFEGKIYEFKIGWQGGFGETISDIVLSVNRFLAEHKGECVVLHIHDYCGFNADKGWSNFDNDEWKRLYDELGRLDGLFFTEGKESTYWLPNWGWTNVVPEGKSGVIVVMSNSRGEARIDPYLGKGFYKGGQWFKSTEILYLTEPQSDEEAAITALMEKSESEIPKGLDRIYNFLKSGEMRNTKTILQMAEERQPEKIFKLPLGVWRAGLLPKLSVVHADAIRDDSIAWMCCWWAFVLKRLTDKVKGLNADQTAAKLAAFDDYVHRGGLVPAITSIMVAGKDYARPKPNP